MPLITHPKGDPRDRYPALVEAGMLTTERVARWQLLHECLCGCGRETLPYHGRPETNQYAYFTNHCWPRVADQYGLRPLNVVVKGPAWRAGVLRENESRLVSHDDSRFYVGLILADIHDRKITLQAWNREKGVPINTAHTWLRQVRAGKRLTKYTVGMILTLLGEEMPDDIAQRYWTRVNRAKRSLARDCEISKIKTKVAA